MADRKQRTMVSGPGVSAPLRDVTAQRAFNTTYQNTSGRPLLLALFAKAGLGPGDFELSIAEDAAFTSKVFLENLGNNIVLERTRTVPAGYYYKLTDTTAGVSVVYSWAEG